MAHPSSPYEASDDHTEEHAREELSDAESEAVEVLSEAQDTLQKSGMHGEALSNHEHVAGLWSAFLGATITAADVAMMMTQAKQSRAKIGKPVRDHFIDTAGYAAIAAGATAEGFGPVSFTQAPGGDRNEDGAEDSPAEIYKNGWVKGYAESLRLNNLSANFDTPETRIAAAQKAYEDRKKTSEEASQ